MAFYCLLALSGMPNKTRCKARRIIDLLRFKVEASLDPPCPNKRFVIKSRVLENNYPKRASKVL